MLSNMTSTQHTFECPECTGGILRDAAGRDERCDMCDGRKRLPGFLTTENEVVDGALAAEMHRGAGEGECPIEDCAWCARCAAPAASLRASSIAKT